MVCEPPPPPPVFAVIDIKTTDEILEFNFEKVLEFNNPSYNLVSVLHFSDTEILNHPRYTEFVDQLAPSVKHVMLNTDYSQMAQDTSYVPIAYKAAINRMILN
jgi:hypothetical protein